MEKIKRIRRTNYNNKILHIEWEILSTNTSSRNVPVRYEPQYIYRYRDKNKKEKDGKR